MEALKETQLYCPFAYIDGSWVAADSGEQIQVVNPATGQPMGDVPRLGRAETERAIEAAHAALPAWKGLTAQERADILMKWHDLMLEPQDDLAMIMTFEQGKPLKEAAGEIAYAASFLRWFAEEARRIYGETIPAAKPNQRLLVTKQPVGVVGAITPWNFPSAMITRKAGAALAAGCTIVIKPASQTPFSATALALLAERAGVPRGVFNVVPGRASEIAAAMTESPLVRKITFHRGGPRADGQCRPALPEDLPGAGRQRAVHRLRGRRPGRRGGGGHGRQVPQRRPDLRLHQPLPGAVQRGQCLLREARRGHAQRAQGGRRHPGGHQYRPADRRERRGQGERARPGRRGQGRRAADGRPPPPAGRQLLHPHPGQLRHLQHEGGPRGDLRPAGCGLPLR